MWSHYPMAIGNQKTIASKSPYLHRLVIGFAITWIYSGFVRVYLFPNLSKIIYFIPILLLFNISLSALQNINISSKNKFKFLSLFFLALVSSCIRWIRSHWSDLWFEYLRCSSVIFAHRYSIMRVPQVSNNKNYFNLSSN